MSYYNCCGIRPKYSNISKRVGERDTTICVVLDQSTVIFQKGRGGGYYNLCGIEIKIVAMLCFISWLLICRVRAPTTLKSEGEVTSRSGADKREVRDNWEKW